MSDRFVPAAAHGEVTELCPDVFWMQGTVRMGPGITINRNMVVLRHDGQLTVINAIRPTPAGIAQLDALGAVTHVLKIGVHGMDDPWFIHQYGAEYWAFPDALTAVPVTQRLTPDGPQPVPWLRTLAFERTTDPEAVLVAERASGVLICGDSLQHWPDTERCSLLGKGVARVMGFTQRPVVIGPPWLKRMTPQNTSLQADFERIATQTFDTMIGAHGAPLRTGAKAQVSNTIREVFGTS